MSSPLLANVIFLEDTLQRLRESLDSRHLASREREAIETKVNLILAALDHYRRASDIEFTIRRNAESTDS